MRLLPIIGPQASLPEIATAFGGSLGARGHVDTFLRQGPEMTGRGSFLFVNSGLAAFYLILSCLKKRASDNRKEVVLPAYTAGSLVVAVRQAGLVPVLCDVSLEDWNADDGEIARVTGSNTLAVVGVHMFGIPLRFAARLAAGLPRDVTFIEDCAQAQGAMVDGRFVGDFAGISFWSFNRGKNLSLGTGGGISAEQGFLDSCRREQEEYSEKGAGSSFNAILKAVALSAISRPLVYGIMYRCIESFKEKQPPRNVYVGRLSRFQLALTKSVFRDAKRLFLSRQERGREFLSRLSGIPGIRCPGIPAGSIPAFNRFPVLVEDDSRIPAIMHALERAGIVSSRMYERPLHHMFDLGYRPEEFPRACHVASHLLTLPSHPGVRLQDIDTMAKTIKKNT